MTLEELIHQHFAEQPHPLAPSLKVGDYPTAARMATVLQFGQGEVNPQTVSGFWHEYQQMNQVLQAQNKMPVGAEEFTHLAKQMAVSSFAYHGRPPSMYEIAKLRDAHPKDIAGYYGSLPDEHYPTVPAAEMAKAMHAAQPWAQQYAERDPVKHEAAYLYHSGQSPKDYYSQQVDDGTQNRSVGQPGVAGPADAGGQPAQPRASDSGVGAGPTPPNR